MLGMGYSVWLHVMIRTEDSDWPHVMIDTGYSVLTHVFVASTSCECIFMVSWGLFIITHVNWILGHYLFLKEKRLKL